MQDFMLQSYNGPLCYYLVFPVLTSEGVTENSWNGKNPVKILCFSSQQSLLSRRQDGQRSSDCRRPSHPDFTQSESFHFKSMVLYLICFKQMFYAAFTQSKIHHSCVWVL